MGEVWAAAKHQSDLGFTKLIALKVLSLAHANENDTLLFYDEAKAASSLEHSAVVSTRDLGEDDDRLYIAMDLVRGPSLTALLQRVVVAQNRFEPELIAYIGQQLGRALDYAYTRATHEGRRLRLVHRDISPHNILLDLNGSVRLTDFGVARTAIQDHRSLAGTIRGKPSYMAPEQVIGGPLDARTDLFALGIVLYELAALRRLFGRKNPLKSMDAVLQYMPRPLTELVPGFPPRLGRVIAKLLEKSPANRFPSAAAFLAALAEASSDFPTMADAGGMLVQKIEDHFDPGDFDADARAEEGLEVAKSREAPTEVRFHDGAATKLWPSAHAPDPLAPEELAALRTRLRTVEDRPQPLPVSAEATPPSFTNRSASLTALRVGPSAVFLWAIALFLVVFATSMVVGRMAERPPPPIPPMEPVEFADESRSSPPKPQPVSATRIPRETPVPRRAAEPPPKPKVDSAPRRAASIDRRRRRSSTAPRPEPKPKHPPRARPKDATYAEVRNLVRRVRAIEPAQGGAMLATLVEAGASNTDMLNRLRTQALLILEGPP